MILLTCKNDWQQAKFYFRTIEACNEFKHVFANHACTLPWNEPQVIPDDTPLSDYWKEHIDDDPKILADKNLKWGWNSVLADKRNAEYKQQNDLHVGSIVKMVMENQEFKPEKNMVGN